MRPEVNWFEYMIVHALEEKLSALGGQPVYAQSAKAEGTTERLFDSIDYLVGRGVHALVIVAYHERPVDIDGAIARADHAGVPVVVVSASNRQWAASNIWTDYRIAGRHAAEHLIENGHRRIVFIGAFTYEYQQQRIDGALDALRAAGCDSSYLTVVIPQPGEHLWDCMTDEAADAGDTLFVRAYETLPQFDAVIAANDWMGAGIVRASQRLGLTPGRAIAVVGFDDQLIARKCDMTTVRFPLERLGIEAAIMAFRAIGGDAQRHRLHIESCLIPRGSTATDVLENARHA
jgi:LacI family transcriptional regulator